MHLEWLTLDLLRYVWLPALSAALIWFANLWKTTADARNAGAGRMDARQEKLFTAQDEAIEDLREQIEIAREREKLAQGEADRWERVARWWNRKAHNLSHSLLSARMGARHALMQAKKPVPDGWDEPDELPQLENPWLPPKPPTPPTS